MKNVLNTDSNNLEVFLIQFMRNILDYLDHDDITQNMLLVSKKVHENTLQYLMNNILAFSDFLKFNQNMKSKKIPQFSIKNYMSWYTQNLKKIDPQQISDMLTQEINNGLLASRDKQKHIIEYIKSVLRDFKHCKGKEINALKEVNEIKGKISRYFLARRSTDSTLYKKSYWDVVITISTILSNIIIVPYSYQRNEISLFYVILMHLTSFIFMFYFGLYLGDENTSFSKRMLWRIEIFFSERHLYKTLTPKTIKLAKTKRKTKAKEIEFIRYLGGFLYEAHSRNKEIIKKFLIPICNNYNLFLNKFDSTQPQSNDFMGMLQYYIYIKRLDIVLPDLKQRYIALCVYIKFIIDWMDSLRGKKISKKSLKEASRDINSGFNNLRNIKLTSDESFLFTINLLLFIRSRIVKINLCGLESWNIDLLDKLDRKIKTAEEMLSKNLNKNIQINRFKNLLQQYKATINNFKIKYKSSPNTDTQNNLLQTHTTIATEEGGHKITIENEPYHPYVNYLRKRKKPPPKNLTVNRKKPDAKVITWYDEKRTKHEISSADRNIILVFMSYRRSRIAFCAYINLKLGKKDMQKKYKKLFKCARLNNYITTRARKQHGFKLLKNAKLGRKSYKSLWEFKQVGEDFRFFADQNEGIDVKVDGKTKKMLLFTRMSPGLH